MNKTVWSASISGHDHFAQPLRTSIFSLWGQNHTCATLTHKFCNLPTTIARISHFTRILFSSCSMSPNDIVLVVGVGLWPPLNNNQLEETSLILSRTGTKCNPL